MKSKNERIIRLRSIHNIRTLGGMRTIGGKIREGLFYRSAALDEVNENDLSALEEKLGVKKVIDLRTEEEVRKAPDRPLGKIRYLYLPVCRDQIPGVSREAEPGKSNITVDMLPDMCETYAGVMRGEEYVDNFAAIIREIVTHRGGALLWHCTAGKDRCGITTAVILSLLGVPREKILEDYLLTNLDSGKTAVKYYWLIRIFKRDKALACKVRDAYMAEEAYFNASMNVIEHEYGGMERFVRERLGIGEEELAAFRAYAVDPD